MVALSGCARFIVCSLLILSSSDLRAEDGDRPKVNIESGKGAESSLGGSRENETPATKVFYFERMKLLHPVQKQVICRLAGDENMSFAHSILVRSIVEQFKALPHLRIGEKEVAEAIELLENHWQLIQKVPGTESRHDPLYQLKDDPNARYGLILWAKHVCSPENIMCDQD